MRTNVAERFWRELRVDRIWEGTSEIQRLVIARSLERRGVERVLLWTSTRLLQPRSVAVVGATERPGSYGGEALLNLRRFGFRGPVYAVNPRRARVHGFPCVPSLADLPEAPDAVVVAIPADGAPEAVEQAGALGCGGAVVFAAGFGGVGGRRGAAGACSSRRPRRTSCPCAARTATGSWASPPARRCGATWSRRARPVPSRSSPRAATSPSTRSRRGAGCALHTVVSCGNEAVLDAADYVEAIAALDGVRSIALYLEDDGDGERWCAALERCARGRRRRSRCSRPG